MSRRNIQPSDLPSSVVSAVSLAGTAIQPAQSGSTFSRGLVNGVDLRDWSGVSAGVDCTSQLQAGLAQANSATLPLLLPGYSITYSGAPLQFGPETIIKGQGIALSRVTLAGSATYLFAALTPVNRFRISDMLVECSGLANSGVFLFSPQVIATSVSGSTVTIAAGSPYLPTANDVGQGIMIPGAGPSGGNLATTVATAASGGSFTITATASTTVTNVTCLLDTTSVADQYEIERVYCKDYTGAAIASRLSDNPFWRIRHNVFVGYNWTSSVGISLGGLLDTSAIEYNNFEKNRYDIKLGGGNTYINGIADGGCAPNINLVGNGHSWIGAGASTPGNDRARVWIVPSASNGTESGPLWIERNKFGPENIISTDNQILIADEDPTTGLDRDTRMPLQTQIGSSPTVASSGYVTGLTIDRNDTGGSNLSAFSPPVVFSATPNLYSYYFGDRNNHDATAPTFFTQFSAPALGTGGFLNPDPITRESYFGIARTIYAGVQNYNVGRATNATDVSVIDRSEGYPREYHKNLGTDDTDLSVINYVASSGWSTSAVSIAASSVTDAYGGTTATTYETTATGAYLYKSLTGANLISGEPAWIVIEAKAGPTTPMPNFQVQASDPTYTHFENEITLDSEWKRYVWRWTPRLHTAGTINLHLYFPGNAQYVTLGQCVVFHGRDAINMFGTPLISSDGTLHRLTVAPGGALLMDRQSQVYLIPESAPTAPTSGGYLYVASNGTLHYRGVNTDTQLAPE